MRAFTPAEIATLLAVADPETGLIVRTLASTGLRFGERPGFLAMSLAPHSTSPTGAELRELYESIKR